MSNEDPVKQAKALLSEILRLARADDHKAVLEIDENAETEHLLGLLSARESGQARAHLKHARVWRAKRNRKALEKLDAANKALDALDMVLARGVLRKIDTSLLGEDELGRYDSLVLAVEARAVEMDEIQSRLPDSPPEKGPARRRGFFKR